MTGCRNIRQALLCAVLICGSASAAWGQATLSLTSAPCDNTGVLVVNLDLVHSTPVAVGAQVFLEYDNSLLQFVSADPGDAPFTLQVFEFVDTGAGTIDYAVGILGAGTGVTAPPTRTMARFTFNILNSACTASNLVTFRPSGPNGALNRVSDNQVPGQPITPLTLNDLPSTRLDIEDPFASSSGVLDDCYDSVAEAEADAAALSSATDNCTASPVMNIQTTGTCNATVTVTFADECGNISNALIYTTRIDPNAPTITCPPDQVVTANTNQCDAVVNYPAPIVNDDCDPAPVVNCSIPSGSVFPPGITPVTCTATDSCGNVSAPCSFDVTVNLLPTTLTLSSSGCQAGGQIVVDIDMSNACEIVVGGQYFLQYDTARLQFVSADPGDAPFTKQVYEIVNPGLGTIDYATGIQDGGTGTSAPTTMARITFNVLSSDCNASGLVTFRPSGPNGIPNRLSDDQIPAQPVLPLALVNLPTVTIDVDAPIISGVPADTTVECDAVPVAPPTLPASDNCDLTVTQATLNPDQITAGPCPQTYTITRTWSVIDDCGNNGTATQIINVQDTTAPTVDPAPGDVTISCENPLPVAPPTLPASDNCDATVVAATLNADQIAPGSCDGNYVVTRTWTATDACGNATTRTQIITVQDITPPTITCPGDTTVQCASHVPAADFAGGSTSDNCGNTPSIMHVGDAISNQTCPNRYTITRTYKATDDCGNEAMCSQTITVDDTTAPMITCPADTTVQCASLVPAAAVDLASFIVAGGVTSDNCGVVATVIHVSDVISNQTCVNRYTVARTYRATDDCGNSAECVQTITVNDTTGPLITSCPSNIMVHAAAGSCDSAPVTYPAATATDNCGGTPVITYNPPSGSTFPPGTTSVLVTATDDCGNSSTCTFDVINDGLSEMTVEVELGGGVMANGSFTRGITFELWNVGVNNVAPLQIVCETMTFSGDFPAPKVGMATLLVPCHASGYTCITGRDRLHTLRRTIDPLPITGVAYTPSFTGAKQLIGGNLNDDKFIDILDFGIYTLQDLTFAPGGVNTICSQVPPFRHADINGTASGLVNSLDYSFIANHFLEVREANCNGSTVTVVAGGNPPWVNEGEDPLTSIPVAELHKRGMSDLATRDLNHDGVFNMTDVQLWGQGVRPTPAPGARTRPLNATNASQHVEPGRVLPP